MKRASRAFAPRPLYGTESITKTADSKVVPKSDLRGRIETKPEVEIERIDKSNEREEIQINQGNNAQPKVFDSELKMTMASDVGAEGDKAESADIDKGIKIAPETKPKRRSSSFGGRKLNEMTTIPQQFQVQPVIIEKREESVPVKQSARPRKNRFQAKPLFEPTANTNFNNFDIKSSGGDGSGLVLREKSSYSRRPFESISVEKTRRQSIMIEEEIGNNISVSKSQGRDFSAVRRASQAEQVEFSPQYADEPIRPVGEIRNLQKTVINFRKDKEKEQVQEKAEDSKVKRAKALEKMLNLDLVNLRVFVSEPYDYERYLAAASATSARTMQASTQTNEFRMEEESQTDPMTIGRVRWTQMPPRWSDSNNALVLEQSIKARNLGVGEDSRFSDPIQGGFGRINNSKNLHEADLEAGSEKYVKFVRRASHLIIAIMESKNQAQLQTKTSMMLDRKLVVLKDLEMRAVCCDKNLIACSNGACSDDKPFGGKNVVTVWSFQEPSLPMFFLRVWGQVMVLEINATCSIVVTGNRDGSMNIFDLKESGQYHTKNREGHVIRAATITTGGMNPEAQNHTTSITGVQILPETYRSIRIFSLDKNKDLIFWICSRENSVDSDPVLGISYSPWSHLRLQIRQLISLKESFSPEYIIFSCFKMWEHYAFNFLIGTNYGFLGKGTIEDVNSKHVKIYANKDNTNSVTTVNSMDLNSDKNLVLAAFDDEFCRLFDVGFLKSSLVVHCGQRPLKVRWSKRRATTFYVLLNDRIDLWDILTSDMGPIKRMIFEQPKDFEVISTRNSEFLVVIFEGGMRIESPPMEIKPLTTREESRFKLYLAVIP